MIEALAVVPAVFLAYGLSIQKMLTPPVRRAAPIVAVTEPTPTPPSVTYLPVRWLTPQVEAIVKRQTAVTALSYVEEMTRNYESTLMFWTDDTRGGRLCDGKPRMAIISQIESTLNTLREIKRKLNS